MGQLRAGVGRAILTPAIGTWLVGFAGRASGCTSIHDDLYATALAIDDGNAPIAILSCDLLAIHPQIVTHVRELVQSSTGIPGQNVMVCCTHTHSGPPGYATGLAHPIDQAYVGYLPFWLAGAVRQAWDRLTPARLGHATGAATIAVNRRVVTGAGITIIGENPDGPFDPDVGVLRIDTATGAPLATVVNYACHPVILGPRSLAVSADFVGRARAVVEAATGAPMLFLQGACGDLNPLGGVQADYAPCHKLGTILGGEIMRVYAGIEPQASPIGLRVRSTTIELPLRPLPEHEHSTSGGWGAGIVLDREFPWAADIGASGVKMEVQAIALGDLAIVATACEPFVETGLAVKAGAPFTRAFFAGYTNGCVGYVPTAHAFPHRGYEVDRAYIGYRLPAPVAPEAEQMVVRECLAALAQLRNAGR